MVLEGIVTTIDESGGVHISPMGPIVEPSMETLHLRPFRTSTTYGNLRRTGQGVFHVTDDVELLAQAAVGQPDPPPALLPASAIQGHILADACRWYAFRVVSVDDRRERAEVVAQVVDRGHVRDFLGFNRGKHAVVEAAILATRIALLPAERIRAELDRLGPIVEKTGGPQERRAFAFLRQYVDNALADV